MKKLVGRAILLSLLGTGSSIGIALADNAYAGFENNGKGKAKGRDKHAPEIDTGTAVSAAALLCGGVLIIRGRRRK